MHLPLRRLRASQNPGSCLISNLFMFLSYCPFLFIYLHLDDQLTTYNFPGLLEAQIPRFAILLFRHPFLPGGPPQQL